MKTKILLFALMILSAMIINLACEKPEQPDTQSAEDDAKGALVVSDAFAFSNSAANGDNGKSAQLIDECLTIEFTGTYPDRVMTITFDSCTSVAGVVRNGQLIVNLSAAWENGKQMVINFNNYSINGVAVEGKVTAQYSLNGDSPEFTIISENMKLTFPDARTYTWSSTKTFLMTAGMSTPLLRYDDIFVIDGTTTGVNRKGESFTSEYIDVVSNKSCDWPESGTVIITKAEEQTTTIEFDQDGTPACDNIIKVTKGDIVLYINI